MIDWSDFYSPLDHRIAKRIGLGCLLILAAVVATVLLLLMT